MNWNRLREACDHGEHAQHSIYTPVPGSRYQSYNYGGQCDGGRDIVIDIDKVARAIYKDYEDCPDSYVDKVWNWEAFGEDGDRAEQEVRDAFRQTVEEFTIAAQHAIEAAFGET